MSPVGAPAAAHPQVPLRHRRDARRLTAGQLADFRRAITAAQAIGDDRGYQRWAGIHGLPLPISCTHHDPLFLPWHRAYLYMFEKALQDLVPGVTLPWWDWTVHAPSPIPAAYGDANAGGQPNPLSSSPIQPSGRRNSADDHTQRQPGSAGALPSPDELTQVMTNSDYTTFQTQLESLHDGVHMWVGGTMTDIWMAAYDPLFWAHHCMIDRVWYLWQLKHPGAGPAATVLGRALAPFPLTVRDTVDVTHLGYDYAAATAAAAGPGHHG